jgi:hypothetical protein
MGGQSDAADAIVDRLRRSELKDILRKPFHDVPDSAASRDRQHE